MLAGQGTLSCREHMIIMTLAKVDSLCHFTFTSFTCYNDGPALLSFHLQLARVHLQLSLLLALIVAGRTTRLQYGENDIIIDCCFFKIGNFFEPLFLFG